MSTERVPGLITLAESIGHSVRVLAKSESAEGRRVCLDRIQRLAIALNQSVIEEMRRARAVGGES